MDGSAAVPISTITPEQALDGAFDSALVQIEGNLIGRDLAASDITLILSSGKSVFHVFCACHLVRWRRHLGGSDWKQGHRQRHLLWSRWTTPASSKASVSPRLPAFRSFSAPPMTLLSWNKPSWWTASRIFMALMAGPAITICRVYLGRRPASSCGAADSRATRKPRGAIATWPYHDELTGLATRTLLHDRSEAALDRAQRFHKGTALLMLDLDKFKEINDYFGHQRWRLQVAAGNRTTPRASRRRPQNRQRGPYGWR